MASAAKPQPKENQASAFQESSKEANKRVSFGGGDDADRYGVHMSPFEKESDPIRRTSETYTRPNIADLRSKSSPASIVSRPSEEEKTSGQILPSLAKSQPEDDGSLRVTWLNTEETVPSEKLDILDQELDKVIDNFQHHNRPLAALGALRYNPKTISPDYENAPPFYRNSTTYDSKSAQYNPVHGRVTDYTRDRNSRNIARVFEASMAPPTVFDRRIPNTFVPEEERHVSEKSPRLSGDIPPIYSRKGMDETHYPTFFERIGNTITGLFGTTQTNPGRIANPNINTNTNLPPLGSSPPREMTMGSNMGIGGLRNSRGALSRVMPPTNTGDMINPEIGMEDTTFFGN